MTQNVIYNTAIRTLMNNKTPNIKEASIVWVDEWLAILLIMTLILIGYSDSVSDRTISGICIWGRKKCSEQEERNAESTNHPQKSNVQKSLKTVCSLFSADHESRGGFYISQSTQQRLWIQLGHSTLSLSLVSVFGKKPFLCMSAFPMFSFN